MILTLLGLLFIKHYIVDFVLQTQEEIKHKGTYFHWQGIKHSLKHGVGTMVVFGFAQISIIGIIILGLIDFVLHYNIDYVKVQYGVKDMTTPQFWNELGADQMAHYFTYLLLIWMTI